MVKVRSNYFNTVAAIVAAITVATALNADAVEGAGVEDYNGGKCFVFLECVH